MDIHVYPWIAFGIFEEGFHWNYDLPVPNRYTFVRFRGNGKKTWFWTFPGGMVKKTAKQMCLNCPKMVARRSGTIENTIFLRVSHKWRS